MTEQKLPRISASQINVHKDCALKYYHKYVVPKELRIIEPKHVGALLGIALHSVIEQYYRNPESLDTNHKKRVLFQQEYTKLYDDWEASGIPLQGRGSFMKGMEDGKAIIDTMDWDQFKVVDPKHLELNFELPFPSREDPIATMVGFIDMIAVFADGVIGVVDHKSQKQLPTQAELDNDTQLVIYAWAYKQMFGELPDRVILHGLRKQKLLIANVQQDFEAKLARVVEAVKAMMDETAYEPKEKGTYICHNFCGFAEECPTVLRERAATKQREAVHE